MKHISTFIVAALIATTTFCQRVDLDKYNFNASYIDLPKTVIDTSFKTFFVEFEAGTALKRDLEEMQLEEMVYIDGWKKLTDNGHVKIFTHLDEVFIENVEVKERVEILKDKDGKETGRKSHYYVQLTYSFAAESKVTDHKGNLITTLNLADRNQRQTYNSKEFTTFIEATLYYKFRGIDFPKEIAKRAVRDAVNSLTDNLNYNYGFGTITVSDFFWILDSKKHPEYEKHRKAWLLFKQAMFQMSAEEPLDEVKKSLVPVISYFESIKKKYSSDSKSDRKLRYASHFNLAKIHYYLDDPDGAMREAGELVMNDFDAKDGKRLEALAADLKWVLKQNKFGSRHFSLQTENYMPPGIVHNKE